MGDTGVLIFHIAAVKDPGQGATYAITRCPGVKGQHFKSCRYSFSSKGCPSRRAGILARFVHDQQLKTEAEAQYMYANMLHSVEGTHSTKEETDESSLGLGS